jgi:hypothetical protein
MDQDENNYDLFSEYLSIKEENIFDSKQTLICYEKARCT